MGQCYSVYLKMKAKDEREFVRLSRRYLLSMNISSEYFLGKDLDTAIGNIRFVLAAHQQQFEESEEDGMVLYRSGFDATYSWETILYDWFCAVSKALEDGSEIEVYPDSGRWALRVAGGIAS